MKNHRHLKTLAALLVLISILLIGLPSSNRLNLRKITEVKYSSNGVYRIQVNKNLKLKSVSQLDPLTLENLAKQKSIASFIANNGLFHEITRNDNSVIIPLIPNSSKIEAYLINSQGELFKADSFGRILGNRVALFNSNYFQEPERFRRSHILPVNFKLTNKVTRKKNKRKVRQRFLIVHCLHNKRSEVLVRAGGQAFLIKLRNSPIGEITAENENLAYLPLVLENIVTEPDNDNDTDNDNQDDQNNDDNNSNNDDEEDDNNPDDENEDDNNQNHLDEPEEPQCGPCEYSSAGSCLYACSSEEECTANGCEPVDDCLVDDYYCERDDEPVKCLVCDWQQNSHISCEDSEMFQQDCDMIIEQSRDQYDRAQSFPRKLDYEKMGENPFEHRWCPTEDTETLEARTRFIEGCETVHYSYQGHGTSDTAEACIRNVVEACSENSGVPPKYFTCVSTGCHSTQNQSDLESYLDELRTKYPWIEWTVAGSPTTVWNCTEDSPLKQPFTTITVNASGVKTNLEPCSDYLGEPIGVRLDEAIDNFECFDDTSCEATSYGGSVPTKTLYACPTPEPSSGTIIDGGADAIEGEWTESSCSRVNTRINDQGQRVVQ